MKKVLAATITYLSFLGSSVQALPDDPKNIQRLGALMGSMQTVCILHKAKKISTKDARESIEFDIVMVGRLSRYLDEESRASIRGILLEYCAEEVHGLGR